jgi:hypothetical protein
MMQRVVGSLRLEVRDRQGRLLAVREGKNLITNVGKARFAAIAGGFTSTLPKYVAIGTNSTAAAATDTVLGTEITTGGGERRLADTIAQTTTTVTDDTVSLTAVFSFTASFAIVEAGLLDAITVGNLFARRVFAAVNVVNGNVVNAVWTVKFA